MRPHHSEPVAQGPRTGAPLVITLLLGCYSALVLAVGVRTITAETTTSGPTGAGLLILAFVLAGAVVTTGLASRRALRGRLTPARLGRLGNGMLGFAAAVWVIAVLALLIRMAPSPESTEQLLLVTMASLVPGGVLTGVGRNLRTISRTAGVVG